MLSLYAATSHTVRLQGPLRRHGVGLVEIFYRTQWGTICDDSWDINDARVVCRQLGYKYALRAYRAGLNSPGTGNIWLDDVNCIGNEPNLTSCSHSGWGNHNCQHSKDAGVECSSAGKL